MMKLFTLACKIQNSFRNIRSHIQRGCSAMSHRIMDQLINKRIIIMTVEHVAGIVDEKFFQTDGKFFGDQRNRF